MIRKKNVILIIIVTIAVGCLLYLPGLNRLGYYRDAWNYFYNLTVRGGETLRQAFNADRPADGYLISFLYWMFGTNINAYIIWCVCCRILSSLFFALALLIIWPRTPKMAGLAGVLAVIFPGFLQQVDVITYIPHQTAMLCFMLSLWLTAMACKPGEKKWNFLYTFLAMLLSFGSMMLMEYYIGMEIYRLGLIYLMNREQAGRGKPKSFFIGIISYIPYLIPAAAFLAWRFFFFHATRAGADVMTEIITPFMQHPRHELADLGVRLAKNIWKLFAGVWTIPAHSLINGMDMKSFIRVLIPSAVIFGVSQLFLFLMHRRKTDESVWDASNEAAQWLWYGLICGSVSIVPLVLSGRDINFTASLDRFSWPGMIGAILFLAGLLGSLRDRTLRNLLTMAAILISVFVQWQNQNQYAEIWQNTRDYWQQLIWRAPSLQQGTTIVTGANILAEEDYEIFAPASMIYYPDVKDWAPVSAEVLSGNTVRDIRMGEKVYRIVREIYTEKDYDQLLAISKPGSNTCLRVIDGENPLYSVNDYSRIPEIGSYSKPEQIITRPENQIVYPFFLSEEQEHGWCYYYEKIELALQMDDPQTAAGLADEAAAKGLTAGDAVELVPVIRAYVLTDRPADALLLTDKIRGNEYQAMVIADYFSARPDAGIYAEVIDALTTESQETAEEPEVTATEEKDGLSAEAAAESTPAVQETAAEPVITVTEEKDGLSAEAAAESTPVPQETAAEPEVTVTEANNGLPSEPSGEPTPKPQGPTVTAEPTEVK